MHPEGADDPLINGFECKPFGNCSLAAAFGNHFHYLVAVVSIVLKENATDVTDPTSTIATEACTLDRTTKQHIETFDSVFQQFAVHAANRWNGAERMILRTCSSRFIIVAAM